MKFFFTIIAILIVFTDSFCLNLNLKPDYNVEINSYHGTKFNYRYNTKKNKFVYQEDINLSLKLRQKYFQANFKYLPQYKENTIYLDSLYVYFPYNNFTVGFISGNIGFVEDHPITKDIIHDAFFEKNIFENYQFNGIGFQYGSFNTKIGGNKYNTGIISLECNLGECLKVFSISAGRDLNYNGTLFSGGYSGVYKYNGFRLITNMEFDKISLENKNISKINEILQYHEISHNFNFICLSASYYERKNLENDFLKTNEKSFRGRIDFFMRNKITYLIYYLSTRFSDFNESQYLFKLKYSFFKNIFVAPQVVFIEPSIGRNYFSVGVQSKWQIEF